MADGLRYIGSGGEVVELHTRELTVGTALALRGRTWSHELTRRGVTALDRPAREESVPVDFYSARAADRARRVFDRDVLTSSPGVLEASGGWSQRCYVLESSPTRHYRSWTSANLTVVLLDGVWRRQAGMQHFYPAFSSESSYLDLPYDLPYDLAPVSVRTQIQGPEWAPAPVRLVVYGPAVNPAVTVGGNVYAVNCVVPEGGYLVVDGAASDPLRRVYSVDANGDTVNRFADAVRGGGQGSGRYIFERIGTGVQGVSWSYSFGFDIGYYEEEGEIPWTAL